MSRYEAVLYVQGGEGEMKKIAMTLFKCLLMGLGYCLLAMLFGAEVVGKITILGGAFFILSLTRWLSRVEAALALIFSVLLFPILSLIIIFKVIGNSDTSIVDFVVRYLEDIREYPLLLMVGVGAYGIGEAVRFVRRGTETAR